MSARSLVSPGVQRDSTTPRRASFSPAAPTTEALDYTFDLCISDPLIIDPSTFALWLDGLTVRDAARARVPPREEDAELYLSTAHKSKGLEWHSVQLADDFPPPYLGKERNPRWNEEEAHLLYVACTRAQHALDVSRCEAVLDALERDAAASTAASTAHTPPASSSDDVSSQEDVSGSDETSSQEIKPVVHPHQALLGSHTFSRFIEAASARELSPEALLTQMLAALPQRQGTLF